MGPISVTTGSTGRGPTQITADGSDLAPWDPRQPGGIRFGGSQYSRLQSAVFDFTTHHATCEIRLAVTGLAVQNGSLHDHSTLSSLGGLAVPTEWEDSPKSVAIVARTSIGPKLWVGPTTDRDAQHTRAGAAGRDARPRDDRLQNRCKNRLEWACTCAAAPAAYALLLPDKAMNARGVALVCPFITACPGRRCASCWSAPNSSSI